MRLNLLGWANEVVRNRDGSQTPRPRGGRAGAALLFSLGVSKIQSLELEVSDPDFDLH